MPFPMSARPRRAPGHCIVGTRMAFTTCSCGIRSIFLYSRNYFFGHCAEAERQDNLGKIGLHNTKKKLVNQIRLFGHCLISPDLQGSSGFMSVFRIILQTSKQSLQICSFVFWHIGLSPGNPVPSFLGAKVNTDVGHVSLPAFNLLAIAERGRIMRADDTAWSVGQDSC